MPTRRQLIQKIELNSDQSSVTFSGIPQNYTDLKLVVSARSSFSLGIGGGYFMEFNDSSGGAAGYTTRMIYGYGTSAGSLSYSTNSNYPGSFLRYIPSATATANTFSSIESYIPNYSADVTKSYLTKKTVENNSSSSGGVDLISSLWNNTAPITKIKLWVGQPDNAAPNNYSNFVSGSTFYLYGITHVPIINGGEVSIRGGFKYHTFRSTGTLQVVEPGDVEYLVVAGGGGGGGIPTDAAGGGGGAGGMRFGRSSLSAAIHTVTVGSGGSAQSNGSNSSLGSIVSSTGGGAGGDSTLGGVNGGSGGGVGNRGATARSGGTGVSGQGNRGGNHSGTGGGATGGGGAGSAGQDSTVSGDNAGTNGGDGLVWPSGSFTYYAGGGGGWGRTTRGLGGIGGGGQGGQTTSWTGSTTGTINTGGGGGSQSTGGSGIVIIRYPYDGN